MVWSLIMCSCKHIHPLNLDGRVTLALMGTRGQEEVEIKYQLLNPAPSFIDVLNEARSVILAGGTMSPVSVRKLSEILGAPPSLTIPTFIDV